MRCRATVEVLSRAQYGNTRRNAKLLHQFSQQRLLRQPIWPPGLQSRQKDKLFLDVRHSQRTQTTRNYFHNISTGDPLDRVNWGGVDNVYAVNPTTVINARVNWNRYVNYAIAGRQGLDPTAIGYPG